MIYIASPYSDPNDAVQYERFMAVRDYSVTLMKLGLPCFSPIAYGRQFQKHYNMGGDFETWLQFNNHMMRTSSKVHVLTLSGWDKSKGVAHEIDFATRLPMPVIYILAKETARGNL